MARVPYVTQDDLDPKYQDLIVSSLQPGKTANVYAAIGNNPAVLSGLRTNLGALWTDSGLTDRQRELVILTAAAEISSTYEWHQHVNIATNAGISREEISAIAAENLDAFDADESTLIRYAQAVVHGDVTDDIHESMAGAFGRETTVGAASVAASYLALGRVIDALGVEIETGDEFVGWDLR